MKTKEEWLNANREAALKAQNKWAETNYESFMAKLADDPWCVNSLVSDFPMGFRLASIGSPAAPTRKAANLLVDKLSEAGFSAWVEEIPGASMIGVSIK
jgi:hypothetical protein